MRTTMRLATFVLAIGLVLGLVAYGIGSPGTGTGTGTVWDQQYVPTLGEHVFLAVSNMDLAEPGTRVVVSMAPSKQILVTVKADMDKNKLLADAISYKYRKKINQLIRAYWGSVGIKETDFAYQVDGFGMAGSE